MWLEVKRPFSSSSHPLKTIKLPWMQKCLASDEGESNTSIECEANTNIASAIMILSGGVHFINSDFPRCSRTGMWQADRAAMSLLRINIIFQTLFFHPSRRHHAAAALSDGWMTEGRAHSNISPYCPRNKCAHRKYFVLLTFCVNK